MSGAPRGKTSILWVVGGLLGLTAIVVAALATRFGSDPNLIASPLVGRPAPVLQLPLLESDGVVSTYDSVEEIVLVNFWASWCFPCRREHAVLLGAAEDWGDAGVRVLGILYQDRAEAGVSFLNEYGRGYDVVVDEGSKAAIEFGVFGVPETFFIQGGEVAAVVRGPLDSGLLDRTLQALLLGKEVESVETGEVQSEP